MLTLCMQQGTTHLICTKGVLCLIQFQLGTSSPRQAPGISSKNLPGGSGFDFRKLPGAWEFDKDWDYVENEIETLTKIVWIKFL